MKRSNLTRWQYLRLALEAWPRPPANRRRVWPRTAASRRRRRTALPGRASPDATPCAASTRSWCGRRRRTEGKRRADPFCGCSACASSGAAIAGTTTNTTGTGTASRPCAVGCAASAPSSARRPACRSYTCKDVHPKNNTLISWLLLYGRAELIIEPIRHVPRASMMLWKCRNVDQHRRQIIERYVEHFFRSRKFLSWP